MIQVDKINKVVVIAPESTRKSVESNTRKTLSTLGKDLRSVEFGYIPTDHIQIKNDDDHERLQALYPMLNTLDSISGGPQVGRGSEYAHELAVDPKTILFVIDPTNKATAALARLLEKQWGGYPFASQTIVV